MSKCFPQSPEMRNLSINAQHIVIVKNPRDKIQIRYFAQQAAPGKVQKFLDVFEDCTKLCEHILTMYIDYLWKINLVDLTRIKEFNDGFTVLLV